MTATTFAWINVTTSDGELIDRFEITNEDWTQSKDWPIRKRAERVLPLERISDALVRVRLRKEDQDRALAVRA